MRTLYPLTVFLCLLPLFATPGSNAQLGSPKAKQAAMVKLQASAPKTVVPGKPFMLRVVLDISKPYHIQADKPKEGYIPTEVSVTGPQGFTVGKPVFPRAITADVAGDRLPVFEGKITVKVPVTPGSRVRPGKVTLPVRVRYQGCNETACFPPREVRTTVVTTIPTS